MDFDFNEEEKLWRQTVNDFVEREITREYVRERDIAREYPYEAYEKVARQGWLGLVVPPEFGGVGFDLMKYIIFVQAMARYSVDFGTVFALPSFTVMNIVNHGTDEQKERYLPGFLKGEIRFSISITEPGAGSDAAGVQTRAKLTDGHYVITGQKVFSSAAHAKGNVITALVRTDQQIERHRGLSMILVSNDTPGLTIRRLPTVARRATGTNEVFFDDVCVPRDNLLGQPGQGWDLIREHLELERVAAAAMYISNAQQAVDDAVAYAKQRVQFGRPIADFQVIRHMLAQMQLEVDAGQLLVLRAADRIRKGMSAIGEVSMAKLYASETLYKVATDGMQILGGYAQLPEMDMERYWREGKQGMVGAGTSQIQRGIIARSMGI